MQIREFVRHATGISLVNMKTVGLILNFLLKILNQSIYFCGILQPVFQIIFFTYYLCSTYYLNMNFNLSLKTRKTCFNNRLFSILQTKNFVFSHINGSKGKKKFGYVFIDLILKSKIYLRPLERNVFHLNKYEISGSASLRCLDIR